MFCSNAEFRRGVFQTETWTWHCLQILKCSTICKRGWYWSRLNPLARATQNLAILISSTSAPLISPSPIDHRLTCATDVQNIQRCSNWNLIQSLFFPFNFHFIHLCLGGREVKWLPKAINGIGLLCLWQYFQTLDLEFEKHHNLRGAKTLKGLFSGVNEI